MSYTRDDDNNSYGRSRRDDDYGSRDQNDSYGGGRKQYGGDQNDSYSSSSNRNDDDSYGSRRRNDDDSSNSYGRSRNDDDYSSSNRRNDDNSYGGGNRRNDISDSGSYSNRNDRNDNDSSNYNRNDSSSYGRSNRDDNDSSSYNRNRDDNDSSSYGRNRNDNDSSSYGRNRNDNDSSSYNRNKNDNDSSSYNRNDSSSYNRNDSSSYGRNDDSGDRNTNVSDSGSYLNRNNNTSSSNRNDNDSSSYGRRDDNDSSSYGRKNDNDSSSYGRKDDNSSSSYGRKDDNSSSTYGRKDDNTSSSYNRNDNSSSSYGRTQEPERPNAIYNRPPEDFDDNDAISHAQSNGGDDSNVYSNALKNAKNSLSSSSFNESSVTQAHQAAYGGNNTGSMDADSLGSAAAMQAMQSLMGGGTLTPEMKTKLVGVAMAEAGKLMDQQGASSGANKQDAMSAAAKVAMQMLAQGGGGNPTIGGANSGGLGQLAGLASKPLAPVQLQTLLDLPSPLVKPSDDCYIILMGLFDLAKDGLQAYQEAQEKRHSRPTSPDPASQGSNQDYNRQRPSEYGSGAAAEYYNEAANDGNRPSSGSHGYSQGGLSAGSSNDIYNSVDKQQAIQAASQHSGDQDSSIFATALNHISSPGSTPSLDHQAVENAHAEAYRKGNAASLDASSMGSAAAMQAFKLFTSGGSSSASSAGNSQSQLLSLAMGEAVKLFNNSGGPATGGKQDVVNSASKTMMKLLLQSKMGGSAGGSQGGLGSLLSMASKFM
ncbi:hypothetical protein FS837_009578 [Tulasnella sp. UAMH 9824]|nr:hypothetical protein FS837_009578 [Tulasnella sp. UAMH 9824]